MNNPANCSDPTGLDPYQFAIAYGGSFIAPGIGESGYGVLGLNIDGLKSSIYVQTQENVGLGFGYFTGWGVSATVGTGPAPTTGVSSGGYAEADAGWKLAGGVSGSLDANGNISAFSGAVPWKIGLGAGAGAFIGNSYTQTAVSPTLQDLTNAVSSIFSSSQSSSSSAANGGFVLYPNKSNTNQMQSVYKK